MERKVVELGLKGFSRRKKGEAKDSRKEFGKILEGFDEEVFRSLARMRALKFLEKYTRIEKQEHNKLQRLPKTNEITIKPPELPIETAKQHQFNIKLKDSQNLSCSSIKFSSEAQSHLHLPSSTPSHHPPSSSICSQSLHQSSKFLDFSCIKERKSRKQLLSEISFESEVHNIYAPSFSS